MMQLSLLIHRVASLKPGQQIDIPLGEMRLASPDDVLENIVGSAYEYSYQNIDYTGVVRFRRREKPLSPYHEDGLWTYVSPDRRHLYHQRPDGLFECRQS